MTKKIRDEAKQLAMRPYTLIVFRDETTDGEPIYMAVNPELDGCMAQGETIQEAEANLAEFRIDYIQHLLEHNLVVPEPAWMATRTEAKSVLIQPPQSEPSSTDIVNSLIQPENREQLFEASLKT